MTVVFTEKHPPSLYKESLDLNFRNYLPPTLNHTSRPTMNCPLDDDYNRTAAYTMHRELDKMHDILLPMINNSFSKGLPLYRPLKMFGEILSETLYLDFVELYTETNPYMVPSPTVTSLKVLLFPYLVIILPSPFLNIHAYLNHYHFVLNTLSYFWKQRVECWPFSPGTTSTFKSFLVSNKPSWSC